MKPCAGSLVDGVITVIRPFHWGNGYGKMMNGVGPVGWKRFLGTVGVVARLMTVLAQRGTHKAMTRVCVRVDGSSSYGLGHIVRSISISQELRKAGAEVTFITETNAIALQKIYNAGFTVDVKDPGACNDAYTRRAFFEHHADVLVIDSKHYAYSAESIKLWGGWHAPVVMIDPMCKARTEASLVIFTNAHQDMETLSLWQETWSIEKDDTAPMSTGRLTKHAAAAKGKMLHGAEYTVLNEHMVSLLQHRPKKTKRMPNKPERNMFLLTTGGSDPKNILHVLVSYQDLMPDVSLFAIVGEAHERKPELDNLLLQPANRVSELTFCGLEGWIDLITHAVCTFGVTAYEMAYLGIPSLTIAHSAENIWGSANFANQGMSIDGGYYKDLTPEKFERLFQQLLATDWRGKSIAGLDGYGAKRVAKAILELVT